MFTSEASARIVSLLEPKELEAVVERSLGRLGRVSFYKRGEFEISGSRFRSFAADVSFDGRLSTGRHDDEWTFRLGFDVKPSGACWAIAIVGFLFILIGPLIFLMPYSTKGDVSRAVENAMRDLQDEIEGKRGR
jgi:hypothetical protein